MPEAMPEYVIEIRKQYADDGRNVVDYWLTLDQAAATLGRDRLANLLVEALERVRSSAAK